MGVCTKSSKSYLSLRSRFLGGRRADPLASRGCHDLCLPTSTTMAAPMPIIHCQYVGRHRSPISKVVAHGSCIDKSLLEKIETSQGESECPSRPLRHPKRDFMAGVQLPWPRPRACAPAQVVTRLPYGPYGLFMTLWSLSY